MVLSFAHNFPEDILLSSSSPALRQRCLLEAARQDCFRSVRGKAVSCRGEAGTFAPKEKPRSYGDRASWWELWSWEKTFVLGGERGKWESRFGRSSPFPQRLRLEMGGCFLWG